jgi:murein tripeptide amidase MpaA
MGQGEPPASTNPKDPDFNGKAPFSEPESRNVKWLLDATPNAQWFIDLHACSPAILYCWGDDQNQSTDATMNYRNAAWDGKRGDRGDAYSEYIPPSDVALAKDLAKAMKDAVSAVRGNVYRNAQSFSLYAVSGTSADYVYARQWETPPKPKVLPFVIDSVRVSSCVDADGARDRRCLCCAVRILRGGPSASAVARTFAPATTIGRRKCP